MRATIRALSVRREWWTMLISLFVANYESYSGNRPTILGLTDAGYLSNCTEENGGRKVRDVAPGRRDMWTMIIDFHARLPANIPEERWNHVRRSAIQPYSLKQISCLPGNMREYIPKVHVVSDKCTSSHLPWRRERERESLYLQKNRIVLSVEISGDGSTFRGFA